MAARIAELEDQAEQARIRAAKFEKDKTKLQIEIRDISMELEAVSSLRLSFSLYCYCRFFTFFLCMIQILSFLNGFSSFHDIMLTMLCNCVYDFNQRQLHFNMNIFVYRPKPIYCNYHVFQYRGHSGFLSNISVNS